MWEIVSQKIQELERLDKTRQLFGAEYHQYNVNPVIETAEIEAFQEKMQTELPKCLEAFYLQVGNGVVGPHYGISTLQALVGYHPAQDYPGVLYYKELADKNGTLSEDGYFEIDHDELKGLLSVINEGCGHEICVATKGPNVGKVIWVSCDGFVRESSVGLVDLYNNWLDESLVAFRRVAELLTTNLTMAEIDSTIQNELNRYDAKDLAVSLMGIEKPELLFGSGNHKIYHGATQDPWYESTLNRNKSCLGDENKGKPWWKLW